MEMDGVQGKKDKETTKRSKKMAGNVGVDLEISREKKQEELNLNAPRKEQVTGARKEGAAGSVEVILPKEAVVKKTSTPAVVTAGKMAAAAAVVGTEGTATKAATGPVRTAEEREAIRGRGAEESTLAADVAVMAGNSMRSREMTGEAFGGGFSRDLVVNVEVEGEDTVTMMQMLRAVEEVCGRVVGCRAKLGKRWELMMSNPKGKERLLDGFKIGNNRVIATEVARDIKIVSFLHLPLYISDAQIWEKLEQWGVEQASEIKRRKWAGTNIFDGTRFLKVRFNDYVKSLPYSTKFETLEGAEYFRILHDNQIKVCRMCLQAGHIVKDCAELKCFRCGKGGHFARECRESEGRREIDREEQREGSEQQEDNEADTAEGEMEVEEGGGEQTEQEVEQSMGESNESEGEDEGNSEKEGDKGTVDSRDIEAGSLLGAQTRGRAQAPNEHNDEGAGLRLRSRSRRRDGEVDSKGVLPCEQAALNTPLPESDEDLRWARVGRSGSSSGLNTGRVSGKGKRGRKT